MFIAIANADHDQMLDNCDVECWRDYWTDTDNPCFYSYNVSGNLCGYQTVLSGA